MYHIVRPQESLWSIARSYLGRGSSWPLIAKANQLRDPRLIFVGQKLIIPTETFNNSNLMGRTRQYGICEADPVSHADFRGQPEKTSSLIPTVNYVFVLADEINPITKKVVRRVLVNPAMALEASRNLGRPLKLFPNPERFGFQATDPQSSLPAGRHAMGMKPSPFISASKRLFGARRFTGTPFWIDVAAAQASGATIHGTAEILQDLDRIAGNTKSAAQAAKISAIRQLVIADSEVLIRGDVPAGAVKGPRAMAMTRGLQGLQIVGFAVSAVELTQATNESIETQSINPIAAETIRQVGGWGSAWAGMKLGAAGGALLGIETGPGAIITGAVGGIVGGFAGYYGFDWVADHIDEN